jgi:acyl dehydratase
MSTPRTIDQVAVGDTFVDRRVVDDAAVRTFAAVSGDANPVHLDDGYAASTRFGRRIAHGALLGAYVSKVLGMDLPGPGAIYLSQSLEFLAPVYVGDAVEVAVTVTERDPATRNVTLSCSVKTTAGEAARGVARVKLPKAG